jgi:hypothetical protein
MCYQGDRVFSRNKKSLKENDVKSIFTVKANVDNSLTSVNRTSQRTSKSLFSYVTGFALGSVEGRVAIQVRLLKKSICFSTLFTVEHEKTFSSLNTGHLSAFKDVILVNFFPVR